MEHHKAGLTMENFFNDMTKKYPKGVKAFGDWIDAYKKAVGWNELFRERLIDASSSQGGPRTLTTATKYHDLPAAMQEGIYWAFWRDRGGCQLEIDDMFAFDFVEDMTATLKMLQEEADLGEGII